MRAGVKGETSIPLINKVSSASDMIEQPLCFAIHIPCSIHNLGVTHLYRVSLTTANNRQHDSYSFKIQYLKEDYQKRFRICTCTRTRDVLS